MTTTSTSVTHDDATYIVDVNYEDGLWVAVVEGLPGGATDAEDYRQLQAYTRDTIATLIGRDVSDKEIVWKLPPGPIDLHDLAADDQCAIHGYEPVPDTVFRICGECHHAYPTEQHLLDADNEVRRQLGVHDGEHYPPSTSAEDVTCCPLCTHDW